ncbi:hypothetical protein L484_007820 [Morus notabilis]|uniref:Uncharacterized protein n=1 Tax=Morus notabilis TaxID=981085 RepID=W9SKT5_9ROSA|nr:hypothetical protein L484_007820 [Morus notabilis]
METRVGLWGFYSRFYYVYIPLVRNCTSKDRTEHVIKRDVDQSGFGVAFFQPMKSQLLLGRFWPFDFHSLDVSAIQLSSF